MLAKRTNSKSGAACVSNPSSPHPTATQLTFKQNDQKKYHQRDTTNRNPVISGTVSACAHRRFLSRLSASRFVSLPRTLLFPLATILPPFRPQPPFSRQTRAATLQMANTPIKTKNCFVFTPIPSRLNTIQYNRKPTVNPMTELIVVLGTSLL